MNKPTFFVFTLFLIGLLSFSNSFAQTENPQSEAGFEVVLHILSASNNPADKTAIPANLSETVNKFKKDFAYSDFRLISTNLQRVAHTGSVTHKSLLNELSRNSEYPVFSEWALTGLRREENIKSTNRLTFQSFTFNTRIPVILNKANPVVNYEAIGITLQRFNVPENKPTLIGTMAMPNANEIIFFVLTVKPTE